MNFIYGSQGVASLQDTFQPHFQERLTYIVYNAIINLFTST